MPDPQDPNSITPPEPGATDPVADSITPPEPGRLAQQLQALSAEMEQLLPQRPELQDAKGDVDRALMRVKALYAPTPT